MSGSPRRTRTSAPLRRWQRHLLRAVGEETNDLGRPVDTARSRALLLTALGITAAAVAGAGVAVADLGAARRHAAASAAHLHRVDAVVLGPARRSAPAVGLHSAGHRAEATWTYPSGQQHTGAVDVTDRAVPGSAVTIWVGDRGRLAAPPPGTADLTADAVCAGLFVLGGLSVVLASGLRLRLRALDRRADDAWQRSWAQVEPGWSGRAARGPGRPG